MTAANEYERVKLPRLLDLIPTEELSIIEADKGCDSKKVRLEILKRGHYLLIPYRGKKRISKNGSKNSDEKLKEELVG